MPRRGPELVTITIDVAPRSKPRIDCDLVAPELQAVGLVTVQWARLEHCLFVRTCQLAEDSNRQVPMDASSQSFTRRLQAFRVLAKAKEPAEAKRLETLADRIANAEGQRHKIVHGLLLWESSGAEDIVAVVSFRPPHHFDVRIDLPRLNKLADQIGELLFEISFPNGLADSMPIPIPPRAAKYKPVLVSRPTRKKGKNEA